MIGFFLIILGGERREVGCVGAREGTILEDSREWVEEIRRTDAEGARLGECAGLSGFRAGFAATVGAEVLGGWEGGAAEKKFG